MDRDPDHKAWMSLRLSRVLDDIGANRQVVKKRREIFLLREAVDTIINKLHGTNHTCFHFGSQSEGTTTLGMNSDIDVLLCDNDTNIMSDWLDWEAGMQNCLMVKEESTPPQHYWLQWIRRDSPEPVRYNEDEDFLPHIDGRVFVSNKILQHIGKLVYGNDFICSGPSISNSEEWDYVYAYKCKVLPPEVDRWFYRHGRRHWPSPEMMQAARECSCFLVPDGHFESLNENIEWRLSPSQIERILVFSFTTVQLKCYVVLKMIKKYIMEQYLSHHSKLTSFHCKTVMFFTIERISPEKWREDRLIGCIGYCLQTLEFFLMKGYCPHYIIPEVNLFEGKITRRYQLLLLEKLKENLNNNLMILYDLQYDSLGQRFRSPTTDMFETRSTICRKINNVLAGDLIQQVHRNFLNMANNELNPKQFLRFFTFISIIHENDYVIHILTRYERRAISVLKPLIYSFLASVTSSFYIQHELQFTPEIFQLYERSLDTDVTSSRLKLASMLYCRGYLRRAVDVLNDVERRYDDNVYAVCGCGRKCEGEKPPDVFSESAINDWNYDTAIRKVAPCVRFTRLEAFCVPPILLYEMNRAVNNDVQFRNGADRRWMDMAVIDSRPYLFYLQYLTYGKLGLRHRQVQAHRDLIKCFRNRDMIRTLHHPETADNLLGHCWEMEGNLLEALNCYRNSVQNVPRNNAANWHIRRLTGNQ
ncbi:uncharacterized protein LOC128221341 isoform X6 [Mya arenaria]|nr:uncharacterized protein LOC128221341 isoform X6 [Mya arenaria]XP_052785887.1 uncharacterized protein LOC128221341 isoform X6 [Mya arenaria]XP_052785888.1 uncharacterized protein LOC128221341 isoform X6 [Mya arenaria]XP_052785889.1 uncharacterized protein LOC128221341 isoform X6 [Mya arenaria]XP_052785890.1 uncharacterized protein LOC128221341 isoform X6 [Mya arenaria]XP_052785891.1 uncharacterized protein LOC128221341 isoform X6 [Mya arenaria]XP_052785893.1 uncharacterized protein LOC12822